MTKLPRKSFLPNISRLPRKLKKEYKKNGIFYDEVKCRNYQNSLDRYFRSLMPGNNYFGKDWKI